METNINTGNTIIIIIIITTFINIIFISINQFVVCFGGAQLNLLILLEKAACNSFRYYWQNF